MLVLKALLGGSPGITLDNENGCSFLLTVGSFLLTVEFFFTYSWQF